MPARADSIAAGDVLLTATAGPAAVNGPPYRRGPYVIVALVPKAPPFRLLEFCKGGHETVEVLRAAECGALACYRCRCEVGEEYAYCAEHRLWLAARWQGVDDA